MVSFQHVVIKINGKENILHSFLYWLWNLGFFEFMGWFWCKLATFSIFTTHCSGVWDTLFHLYVSVSLLFFFCIPFNIKQNARVGAMVQWVKLLSDYRENVSLSFQIHIKMVQKHISVLPGFLWQNGRCRQEDPGVLIGQLACLVQCKTTTKAQGDPVTSNK